MVERTCASLLQKLRLFQFLAPSKVGDALSRLLPSQQMSQLTSYLRYFRWRLVGASKRLASFLGIGVRASIPLVPFPEPGQLVAQVASPWATPVVPRGVPVVLANGISVPLPRKLTYLLGVGTVAYTAYKVFRIRMWAERWMKQQRGIESAHQRTSFLQSEYEEVKSRMEELGREAIRDRMEDLILKDIITPEVVEDGKVVQKEVSQYLIKHYGRFVRHLVAFAKVEFNGVPKNTEANMLAVWRFMYRVCEKRGLNTLDAQRALSSALPFVFLPSHYDQDMAITMNCEDTVQSLQRYKEAFMKASPLTKLLDNPLSGAAWKAWANSILYGDQDTGLHFAK